MKKKILSIAFIFILLFSFQAAAFNWDILRGLGNNFYVVDDSDSSSSSNSNTYFGDNSDESSSEFGDNSGDYSSEFGDNSGDYSSEFGDNYDDYSSYFGDTPFDDGAFDYPFDYPFEAPFDEPPIFPPIIPPIIPPVNFPAKWDKLHDVSIYQGYSGMIYENLALKCHDPDGPTVVNVKWKGDFNLFFSGYNLYINKLNPELTGKFAVKLYCNGIPARITLNILSAQEWEDETEEDDDYDSDLIISSIFIPNAENAKAGENLAINVVLKNSGEETLENTRITAILAELGARTSAGPFDIKRKQKEQRTLFLDIPEWTASGTYYLRLGVYNNDIRRVVYREINIEN